MNTKPSREQQLAFLFSFLQGSNSSIVISDAAPPDHPIVFVNPAFEQMTGYFAPDVLGRNCRFLQGTDREQPGRAVIARALSQGVACEASLRNYRKNGEMFWNKVYVFPIRNDEGAITHFAGVQHDVSLERSLFERLEQEQRQLAALSHELIHAQEAERKALAQELHDELGQRLSALNLLLHRSLPYLEAGGAQELWRQAERELGSMVALVRDMTTSLRPPALDYFGLEPTINTLMARQLDGGPDWVFEYAGLPRRLAPTIEISVYRIVQESLTNIVRHAKAGHVVVEINGGATGEELELIVRDDGVGFDAAHWREAAVHAQRAGLAGMGERARMLGGSFAVDSRPGSGTRITAVLPLRGQKLTGSVPAPGG